MGVPPCHQRQEAGQLSGRHARPDGADPAGAAPADNPGGAGCGGRIGELQRLAQGACRGRVDGQENPVAVIYSNRFYETQRYLAMYRPRLQHHGARDQPEGLGQIDSRSAAHREGRERQGGRVDAQGGPGGRGRTDRSAGSARDAGEPSRPGRIQIHDPGGLRTAGHGNRRGQHPGVSGDGGSGEIGHGRRSERVRRRGDCDGWRRRGGRNHRPAVFFIGACADGQCAPL